MAIDYVKRPPPAPAPAPAVSLTRVQQAAPGLVSYYKAARVSLEKVGLAGQRVALYLLADRSRSVGTFFRDGSIPHHAERVLGLSANLDDDGAVPLFFFDTIAHPPVNLSLANYEGQIEAHHRTLGKLGRTNLHLGIEAVVAHYLASGSTHPAYVATMLDGRPDSPAAVRRALCDASTLPIVWDLHGWGDRTEFLRELDNLPDDQRAVDNVELLEVGPNPRAITDTQLYEHMTGVLSRYLDAARPRGIVR